MKFYQLTTTIVILSEIWIAGCQPYPNYEAYHDVENRGEAIFKRDLENCKSFADQHLKPAEGSEGAGELFNRKRSFMRNCMGNKQWVLKN